MRRRPVRFFTYLTTGPLKGSMLQFFADSTNFTRRWARQQSCTVGCSALWAALCGALWRCWRALAACSCAPRPSALSPHSPPLSCLHPAPHSPSIPCHPSRRLTDIRANAKFSSPYATADDVASGRREDLRSVVEHLRKRYGVQYIYCWHGERPRVHVQGGDAPPGLPCHACRACCAAAAAAASCLVPVPLRDHTRSRTRSRTSRPVCLLERRVALGAGGGQVRVSAALPQAHARPERD